jgi:hypothetical protein
LFFLENPEFSFGTGIAIAIPAKFGKNFWAVGIIGFEPMTPAL